MNHVTTVRVPAKVMLAGEYSILNGGSCFAITIDKYFSANFLAITDDSPPVLSSTLWKRQIDLNQIPTELKEEPAVELAEKINKTVRCSLNLQSDFPPSFGFGSSSALRLALNYFDAKNRKVIDPLQESIHESTIQQRKAQNRASGYDIVCQASGGPIEYFINDNFKVEDFAKEKVDENRFYDYIHIYVGGSGSPTSSDIKSNSQWLEDEGLSEKLLVLNQALITTFKNFTTGGSDIFSLIKVIKEQRNLFEGAPNFPAKVLDALRGCSGLDKTFSFKPTGAGGEDCLLLVGSRENLNDANTKLNKLGWRPLPYKLEYNGLQINGGFND